MNINGIYAGSYAAESISVDQKGTYSSSYEAGQVLEGIVSRVSEKVTINFSGNEISFPKESVQNAREGEIRKYQIMDVSGTSLVLKEIGTTQETSRSSAMTLPVNAQDQNRIREGACTVKESDDTDQDDLSDAAARMTKEDYASLSDEGMTLEKFNLERLDRAIDRIKSQRDVRDESVRQQAEDLKMKTRKVKEDTDSSIADTAALSGLTEQIAQRLLASDLPATEENVSRIAKAMNLAKEAASMTDASFSYLIDNQLKPTIENVYKAVHAGSGVSTPVSEEVWDSLKSDAASIILDAGMTVSDETMQDARWLVEEGLPMTAENLQFRQTLQTIREGVDQTELLNKTVESLRARQKPEEAEFIQSSEDAAQEGISQESTGKITDLINRRKLEETRLMMTIEAKGTAFLVGIDTDIEGLNTLVEKLKDQENSYYQNLMKETGTPASSETLELLKNTTETMAALQNAPEYILGMTMQTQDEETIQTLAEEGTRLTARLMQAGESYEVLMTRPRKDMGDSIQKAFTGIEDTLQSMELEPTKANERAVRILGYNQIPITKENISNIKLYDAKVNELIQNLKPPVTVELIRQGVNPIEMPVDELNKTVSSLLAKTGATEEEKYSEYLVNLSRKDSLTQEERASYIGIYRLLNNIDKTDGAAIGATIKAGRELTLSNLLTAVRTIKKGGIDVGVDESFGGIKELTFSKESITSQVNTAFSESSMNQFFDNAENRTKQDAAESDMAGTFDSAQEEYQQLLVQEILHTITPEGVAKLMANKSDWKNTSLEETSEIMQEAKAEEQGNAWQEEKLATIRTLAKDSAQELAFLQDAGIDKTLQNLTAVKELRKGNSWFQTLIETAREASQEETESSDSAPDSVKLPDLTDSIVSKDTLSEACSNLDISARQLMNEIYAGASTDTDTLWSLMRIQAGIEFCSDMRQKEYYEIPVDTTSGTTTMNLTVVHTAENAGRVSISIQLPAIGRIKAEGEVELDGTVFTITTDSKAGRDILKADESSIKAELEELLLSKITLRYLLETKNTDSFIFRNGDIYKQAVSDTVSDTESDTTPEIVSDTESDTTQDTASDTTPALADKQKTDELYLAAKALIRYFCKNDTAAG